MSRRTNEFQLSVLFSWDVDLPQDMLETRHDEDNEPADSNSERADRAVIFVFREKKLFWLCVGRGFGFAPGVESRAQLLSTTRLDSVHLTRGDRFSDFSARCCLLFVQKVAIAVCRFSRRRKLALALVTVASIPRPWLKN